MTTAEVIAERLKQVRKQLRISRKQLADASRGSERVTERTITRLEKGEISSPRQRTIDILAKGLSSFTGGIDIAPQMIIGDLPIPRELNGQPDVNVGKNQFNVRVSAKIRNAYELAAKRYGVSTVKIAQLAPLLFVIIAEESLKYRREELERKISRTRDDEFESALSYLPRRWHGDSFNLLSEEEQSIVDRDLFGAQLAEKLRDWRKYHDDGWAWDEAQCNPFEAYLRAAVAKLGKDAKMEEIISVNAVGPASNDYEICRTAALELVGSDFAESLLKGRVAIDRSFRRLKTPEERIAWICENAESEAEEELLEPLAEDE